jgi:outer membrane protein assembly factor BamD (BamD/ComL family)
MKRVIALGMLCIGLLAACSSEKGKELFDTAQFEEKQHNQEHAVKLYTEIVTKYPKSPVAKQAQERLDQLAKQPVAK